MENRIPESMIVRLPQIEKKFGIEDMNIYAYMDGTTLKILGEIITDSINSGFKLICNVYDKDGDIVESKKMKRIEADLSQV